MRGRLSSGDAWLTMRDDLRPHGGVDIVQDGSASVRYQLVARSTSFLKQYVVVRCYEDGAIGLSAHGSSTLDACGAPRPIRRLTDAKTKLRTD